jgi:hypothetical protein
MVGLHQVASASHGTKRFHHPLGDLTLDADTRANRDDQDQSLMILTAEPGIPSHQALRILTSWTADAPQASDEHTSDVMDH